MLFSASTLLRQLGDRFSQNQHPTSLPYLRFATIEGRDSRGNVEESKTRNQRLGELGRMLADYIERAMELATYEIVEEDGTYWGEIPLLQGVWANHLTLEGCRQQLREALSDWLALRLRLGLSIPVIEGIDLNQMTQQLPLA